MVEPFESSVCYSIIVLGFLYQKALGINIFSDIQILMKVFVISELLFDIIKHLQLETKKRDDIVIKQGELGDW